MSNPDYERLTAPIYRYFPGQSNGLKQIKDITVYENNSGEVFIVQNDGDKAEMYAVKSASDSKIESGSVTIDYMISKTLDKKLLENIQEVIDHRVQCRIEESREIINRQALLATIDKAIEERYNTK